MARKLNLLESEQLGPDQVLPGNESENPVIVVVSEAGSGRTFVEENDSSITESRENETSAEPHPKNMPYLERIPNYAVDSPTMYPGPSVPSGFLPRFPDRGEFDKESNFRDRVPPESYNAKKDAREPWNFSKKHGVSYQGPSDLPGHYGPYAAAQLSCTAHMYSSPYSMSYPSAYMRYSTMHTTQAGKPCCSSAYSTHPQLYPPDLYTIPIEEYNKSLYGKEARTYKTPSEQSKKLAERRGKSPSELPTNKDQLDQIESRSLNRTEDNTGSSEKQDTESSEQAVEGFREQTEEGRTESGFVEDPEKTGEIRSFESIETEQPSEHVKIIGLNTKENCESPSSGLRPESNETNSQAGSVRSNSLTHSSPSESPLSSSNHSGEQVISPSNNFYMGSLPTPDDVSEEASKQRFVLVHVFAKFTLSDRAETAYNDVIEQSDVRKCLDA